MIEGERSRKRAVRLRPEALACLRAALHEKWERNGGGKKLTREARADILGLSVATCERLLSGKGVDRPTLTLAFRNLALTWDDSFCELDVPKSQPPTEVKLEEVTPSGPATASRRSFKLYATAMCLAAVAFLGIPYLLPDPDGWKPEFHRALAAGSHAFHEGKMEAADRHLSLAARIARQENAGRDLSSALRMQADLASARGDFDRALELYGEAAHIRRAFHDDPSMPAILEAQGDLETRMGRYDEAREHLNQSLEGFRKAGDPVGIAMVCRNLGTLVFEQGQIDAAETWLRTSLSTLDGLNKSDLEVDIRARMALVLRERNQLDEASRRLQECLDYWTQRDHTRWVAVTQRQLGTVLAKMDDWDRAGELFESSRNHFKAVGDLRGCADSEALLRSARRQGSTAVAHEVEAVASESPR